MIADIRTVSLENGSFYYYKTSPYSLSNAIGNEIAHLTEIIFSLSPNFDEVLHKLYKTAEGSWYDMNYRSTVLNGHIIHALKKAMDVSIIEG